MPAGLFRSSGFICVNVANFLDGLCYFGMVPLLIPFLHQYFGLGDVQAGQVVSYYVGLVTLLMFPGGWVCDRLGSRRALIVALGLLSVGRSLLVFSAHQDWGIGWALLALTLMATGTGIVQPSVYAAVKEYTLPSQSTSGYAWLYAIMNLGTVVWFLISPSVRGMGGGIVSVYFTLAGLTWLNWLLQLTFFRQPPLNQVKRTSTGWSWELFQPRFLVFIWLLIPVRNLVAHLTFTLPTYVERVHAAIFSRLEYCFALNSFLLFVATPLFARLTLGWPILTLMIGGSLISVISLGFFALPGGVGGLIAFIVLFSLGEAIWQSRFFEYVAHIAPPGQVGAAMSLANFPWFVTKSMAGLYSGWMLQTFVPHTGAAQPERIWLVYAAVALLTPISLALCRPWLEQMRSKGSDSEQTNSTA